ncbi:MAG TPA: NAD(P)-binding domain-containing protein [Anaeromyxobacteraceae bacterium]|nr:NAD(P)-binding domain-containing protein [Anaeromyxobacteraceae bacterium]
MKVAILGSGMVGQMLGTGFAARGHEVVLGTRDPSQERLVAWVKGAGEGARAATFAEAAGFGEVAVLATLWSGTRSAIELAGPANLRGKVVIDVTNPLDFSGGRPRLALGWSDSGGEQVQRWLPDSRVVKTWNIVTAATMVSPMREEGLPDMWMAGNDPEAKRAVSAILAEFGWPVLDLGGIEGARLLEPMAMVWIHHFVQTKDFRHAFKMLRR